MPVKEPKSLTNRHNLVLSYDLMGWTAPRIAKELKLTEARIRQIKGFKLYKARKATLEKDMHEAIFAAQVANITAQDPVIKKFREAAPEAADGIIKLAKEADSEFVRGAKLSEILDRAGYKVESKKVTTSVEVTEEMASRWDKTLERIQSRKMKVEESIES